MSSTIKVLQVIPKLGFGGAETGCYDLAHFLAEQNCKSFLITSGGQLLKYVRRDKVKVIRLPVQSKNPIIIFVNSFVIFFIIIVYISKFFGFSDFNIFKFFHIKFNAYI